MLLFRGFGNEEIKRHTSDKCCNGNELSLRHGQSQKVQLDIDTDFFNKKPFDPIEDAVECKELTRKAKGFSEFPQNCKQEERHYGFVKRGGEDAGI